MCFIITLNSRIHKSNDLVNRMMQTSFHILIISLTILYLYAVPKEIWGWGVLTKCLVFHFFSAILLLTMFTHLVAFPIPLPSYFQGMFSNYYYLLIFTYQSLVIRNLEANSTSRCMQFKGFYNL